MTKFLNFGKSLWQDEIGATAIEYGLLAALIAVAIIVTVTALGGKLNDAFASVKTDLTPSVAAPPGPVRLVDKTTSSEVEPSSSMRAFSSSSLRR